MSVRKRHIRCLGRLDPDLSTVGKDLFWHIAQNDNRFRALQHMDNITDQVLKNLWRAPFWMEVVNPKIFKFADVEVLEHMAMLRQYRHFGPAPEDAGSKVKSARSKRDLMALNFIMEFPDCPIPGDDLLEPITVLTSLKRVGRELRNCAADLARDVVEGRMYFLLWKGRRSGLVQIKRGRDGDWKFGQAHGVGNSRLHPSTIKAITRRLSEMGL